MHSIHPIRHFPLLGAYPHAQSQQIACRALQATSVILEAKYLNKILKQDHRFIKRITAPMLGFKSFHSAAATIAGIEAARMIRKRQFGANGLSAFQQFAALAE